MDKSLLLRQRESGVSSPLALTRRIALERERHLQLSTEEEVDTVGAHLCEARRGDAAGPSTSLSDEDPQMDGVFTMDIERAEGRYLLAGGMEGSVIAYDTWAAAATQSRDERSHGAHNTIGSVYSGHASDSAGIRKISSVFCIQPRTRQREWRNARQDTGRNSRTRERATEVGRTEMTRMQRLNYREDLESLVRRHRQRDYNERRARQSRARTNATGDRILSGQVAPVASFGSRTGNFHTSCVNSVQWYPVDSGCFVTAGNEGRIIVWDSNTLAAAIDFHFEENRVYKSLMPKHPRSHCLIAAAMEDPGIRLCDMVSGSCVHTLIGNTKSVQTIAWSPRDEHVLVSGSADGSIRFFDIRRTGAYMILDQNNAKPTMLDEAASIALCNGGIRSDGSVASSGGRRGCSNARKRMRSDGQLTSSNSAKAHNGGITAVTFTTDGTQLMSAGADGRIRLWDSITGLNTMVNYSATPRLKEGNEIAITSDSSTAFIPGAWDIGVYDVRSGKELTPLRGHFDRVNTAIMHPTEQTLYSGGGDSQILVWCPARPDSLNPTVCCRIEA